MRVLNQEQEVLVPKEDKHVPSNNKWKYGVLFILMVSVATFLFLSGNNTFGSTSLKSANVATSSSDYDYISRNLFTSQNIEESMTQYLSESVVFYLPSGQYTKQELIDQGYNFNEFFGLNAVKSNLQYSTISKPKYTVEWAFGMRTNKLESDSIDNTEEQILFVFNLDATTQDVITEVHYFTSKESDSDAKSLHSRLFTAFDFNDNGVLCITEFPSLMGGVTGLGNLETTHEILSYMNDDNNQHLKLTQDQYVEYALKDNSEIKNFGDLRHHVQNSIIDAYNRIMLDSTCSYYDMSWNCLEDSQFENNNLYHVSSLFSSLCCSVVA